MRVVIKCSFLYHACTHTHTHTHHREKESKKRFISVYSLCDHMSLASFFSQAWRQVSRPEMTRRSPSGLSSVIRLLHSTVQVVSLSVCTHAPRVRDSIRALVQFASILVTCIPKRTFNEHVQFVIIFPQVMFVLIIFIEF